MSRSKKKTPKIGISSASTEKDDKRKANRKLRRINKVQVRDKNKFVEIKEISNIWSFGKDGKQFLKSPSPKDLRK